MKNAGRRSTARLVMGGAVAVCLTMGALAPSAQAASAGWEAILGGHLTSRAAATRLADRARAAGFKVYVQKISSKNYEAEIFNGGRSRRDALAVCTKAKAVGLAHCSVEQEFHGNHWG